MPNLNIYDNIKAQIKQKFIIKLDETKLKKIEKNECNKSKNISLNKSHQSTKGSSNSKKKIFNITLNNESNNKSDSIREDLFQIYNEIEKSSPNLYYKKKVKKTIGYINKYKDKNKIKQKDIGKVKKKKLKLSNYEKPIFNHFKKFLKSKGIQKVYKNIFENDKLFWYLFLNEN